MTNTQTPYDFVAQMFDQDMRDRIVAFWKTFVQHADEIDGMFSRADGGTADIVQIMQALEPVSKDLMWEFGPSDRGHLLCVTAEFRDELRPLARLVMRMAPDLPRWRFVDARPPDPPEMLEQVHQNRFRGPITVEKIEATIAVDGRIDQVAYGAGSRDELLSQTLNISTILLGEEQERDWIGLVDPVPNKGGGLLGLFRGNKSAPFDGKAWLDMMQTRIKQAQGLMPDVPYSKLDMDTRPYTVASELNLRPDHRRNDLITFTASNETYLQAAVRGGLFSSRCHSRFGEWFMYLRVPTVPDGPFDTLTERAWLEERLHELLSENGRGGVVAAGHGSEGEYIDIAVTDVGAAVALIQADIVDVPFASGATLHFLDTGVEDYVLPATANHIVH